jgi:tight adherence protein C
MMDTQIIVILVSVFIAVAAIAGGIVWWLFTDRIRRRVADVQGPAKSSAIDVENQWMEHVVRISRPLAKLSFPSENWVNSPIRHRLTHAGWRGRATPTLFFGSKTLLAIVFPLLLFMFGGESLFSESAQTVFVQMMVLASVGYLIPNGVLHYKVRQRQRTIVENFPDALDLMTICVEAGLGLDASLKKVADEIHLKSKILAQELQWVIMELRAGFSKEQALRNFAIRTGVDEIELFVAMIIQSDRFGTAMSESLRIHSENLRVKRRQRAEEAAEKISLKLLFPLIFLIFPTLMLILAGPAMLQIYRLLLPAMAG